MAVTDSLDAEDFGSSKDAPRSSPITTKPFNPERAEFTLKSGFTNSILTLFAVANFAILIIVGVLIWRDWVFLSTKVITSTEQTINDNVIMTLIGATTVQVGTAVLTITRSIFAHTPKTSGTSR